jgi:hypothetical protein
VELPTPVRDCVCVAGQGAQDGPSPDTAEVTRLLSPKLTADITRCMEAQLQTGLAAQRETLSALHAAEIKALTAKVLQLQAQLRGTRSGSAA